MEKKTDPRTVFVRGIDATVADAQLQEFFSDVGPVKNAFLVRRGKDGPHRGFGFVQFAVQEDAVRAAEQLNGVELAGRKLKVRTDTGSTHQHASTAAILIRDADCSSRLQRGCQFAQVSLHQLPFACVLTLCAGGECGEASATRGAQEA